MDHPLHIRAYHKRFDQALDGMIAKAANYFGRDSGGLQCNVTTEVKLGDLQVLEDQ